ncbi:hypothetical protein BLNAU_10653 [Blattamonas nauphoetae]|uniref:Uncharacterized protein n=1 Tax=Blattamonas nauphoetae TaxID=2049346 RepID=A0ABQ9XPG6_9EUKA|nr:hypothetical protein BLNAU_10653 [Blattamonas nauphoetae]
MRKSMPTADTLQVSSFRKEDVCGDIGARRGKRKVTEETVGVPVEKMTSHNVCEGGRVRVNDERLQLVLLPPRKSVGSFLRIPTICIEGRSSFHSQHHQTCSLRHSRSVSELEEELKEDSRSSGSEQLLAAAASVFGLTIRAVLVKKMQLNHKIVDIPPGQDENRTAPPFPADFEVNRRFDWLRLSNIRSQSRAPMQLPNPSEFTSSNLTFESIHPSGRCIKFVVAIE